MTTTIIVVVVRIKAVVPTTQNVVQAEMGVIAVLQVTVVVRTVAARLRLSSAMVMVIARGRPLLRHHRHPLARLLRRLRPIRVLKREELAKTRIRLNAVVGDSFSVPQVESISIYLAVQARSATNHQGMYQLPVDTIDEVTGAKVIVSEYMKPGRFRTSADLARVPYIESNLARLAEWDFNYHQPQTNLDETLRDGF